MNYSISTIDLEREPWVSGARYLAGMPLPDGAEEPDGPVRVAARAILVENRERRARGEVELDYMAVRERCDTSGG